MPPRSEHNRFRARRARMLGEKIRGQAAALGRELEIVDIGGRPAYWQAVGTEGIARITLVNIKAEELSGGRDGEKFVSLVGDARDLSRFEDGQFDLVHSNSVIEHVGLWDDICRMAAESRRIGRAGWIQTPAWEFVLEPHFRVPFMHWFSAPVRRVALRANPRLAKLDMNKRRRLVDHVNLLTFGEVRLLYPEADIWIERFLLMPKSYVARW